MKINIPESQDKQTPNPTEDGKNKSLQPKHGAAASTYNTQTAGNTLETRLD